MGIFRCEDDRCDKVNDNDDLWNISDCLARLREHRAGFSVRSGAIETADIIAGVLDSMSPERCIALLRNEVEATLSVVGVDSIEKMLNSRIPSAIAEDVGERAYQLHDIGFTVRLKLQDQVVWGNLVQPHSELTAYYKEEYEPYLDKIGVFYHELFCRDPEDKKKILGHTIKYMWQDLPESEKKRIVDKKSESVIQLTSEDIEKIINVVLDKDKTAVKHVFQVSVDLLQKNYERAGSTFLHGYDGKIHKGDYLVAKDLISSDYFHPDEWLKNIMSIGPIFSPREEKNFPLHIRDRVHQMYRSFVFENWMSVVALGRSLLEYMIIDRRSSLGIEVYEKDHDGVERPKKISRLVDLIATTDGAESFEKDMREIIEYGNNVMHPEKTRKVRVFPSGRKDALDCMKRTIKIIQILYKIKK